jgi:hypothetical protein
MKEHCEALVKDRIQREAWLWCRREIIDPLQRVANRTRAWRASKPEANRGFSIVGLGG